MELRRIGKEIMESAGKTVVSELHDKKGDFGDILKGVFSDLRSKFISGSIILVGVLALIAGIVDGMRVWAGWEIWKTSSVVAGMALLVFTVYSNRKT